MSAGSVSVPTVVPLRVPQIGKPKNLIDSNVRIELKSETPEVRIYYTTNGNRPEPFALPIGSARDTFKYQRPFTLRPGKRTIKAMAVSKDNRESFVVTKAFDVEWEEPEERVDMDDDLAFQNENLDTYSKAATKKLMSKILRQEGWTEGDPVREPLIDTGLGMGEASGGARFSKARYDRRTGTSSPTRRPTSAHRHQQPSPAERLANEAMRLSAQGGAAQRLQQKLGDMRCQFCQGPRPSDPMAQFCTRCGNPVPPVAQPQATPLRGGPFGKSKLGVCPSCRSSVPFNTTTCLVCETPLAADYQPRYATQAGNKLVCTVCGSANPANFKTCATCESRLYAPAWTSNNAPAAWQATMGPPVLDTGRPRPVMRDEASQTVGLYFPSEREIQKRVAKEDERMNYEKNMRTTTPLMTAVSPGKGYWRKQMDHMCAHLRAHAQNNAEFRALIGEPRMSKILSTAVHEDGYEMSLTVTFALKGNKDPFKGQHFDLANTRGYLSTQTTGHSRGRTIQDYISDDDDEDQYVETDRSERRRKPKPKRQKKKEVDRLLPEERALLKEVGKNGEGRHFEVQKLIDEGADANVMTKAGIPVLHVASINQHTDAVPVLTQAGAKIDAKAPPSGNTALHEAVNLGSRGLTVVEILLDCGANANQPNDKGQTPYDLAAKSSYEGMVAKFAAKVGQSKLERLSRPRSPVVEADAF